MTRVNRLSVLKTNIFLMLQRRMVLIFHIPVEQVRALRA